MTRDAAVALAPNFYLDRYFAATGAPSFSELNVSNPDFFKQVNGVMESESLDTLKTYVSWHLLRGAAPWLSQPFVDANFKMRQALTGQKEIQAQMEALRGTDRRVSGRGAGPEICGAHFRGGRQTAHVENGGCARKVAGRGYPGPALDDATKPRNRPRSSCKPFATRLAIPTCGATTVR